MSGHSKWSNIKGKKAVADAKRSKVFCFLSKNIRVAVRQSGIGDPSQNPSLRVAVEKAHESNMPNELIQRASNRGMGKGESGALEHVTYEGYGPHGVGFYIAVQTDNKNRTGSEIRTVLTKAGGSLGSPGSAAYLFARDGAEMNVVIPLEITDPAAQEQLQELYDTIEAHDDVEAVYWNAVFV
jgi:YebC/PmpR family DNA-binding regulatory protein